MELTIDVPIGAGLKQEKEYYYPTDSSNPNYGQQVDVLKVDDVEIQSIVVDTLATSRASATFNDMNTSSLTIVGDTLANGNFEIDGKLDVLGEVAFRSINSGKTLEFIDANDSDLQRDVKMNDLIATMNQMITGAPWTPPLPPEVEVPQPRTLYEMRADSEVQFREEIQYGDYSTSDIAADLEANDNAAFEAIESIIGK